MLKIAHIVRRFTFSEWGGTENVVWHTVQEQKKQGLEPEILCTAALDRPGTETVEGITIRRFPYCYPYFPLNADNRLALDKKGGNPLCPQLMKTLRRGSYDLIHLHAGGRLALYAEKIAAARHLPVVLSLHGGSCAVPAPEMEMMLRPIRHKFSYGGILDRILKTGRAPEQKADLLLALSAQEQRLLQKKFSGKRVVLFPNGVPRRPLPEPDPDFRRRLHIPEQDRIILCVSRIDYQKNQKILVELTALLRRKDLPVHLLLTGPVTSQWYCDALLQTVRDLNMEKHFTLIPGLPPDSPELMQTFRQADCFVLPSLHEPFGIAALEALDAGVPLLAASTGGLTDFLQDHQNALMFPGDSLQGLAACFQALTQEPGLREKLIVNGRKTVEDYRWPQLIRRLTELYRGLLNG